MTKTRHNLLFIKKENNADRGFLFSVSSTGILTKNKSYFSKQENNKFYLNKQGRIYRTVLLNEVIVSGPKNVNIDLFVKPVKKSNK